MDEETDFSWDVQSLVCLFPLMLQILDQLVHETTTDPASCSYASQLALVAGIVTIAVERLQHYQAVHSERGDDLSVADSMVDQSDFECTLCTG